MVGEAYLHKEELAFKPSGSLFSHYLVEHLVAFVARF